MHLKEFKEKKEEFLLYLKVEKNFADHTQSAYNSDLELFISFWSQLTDDEKKHLTVKQIIERYLVSLFYKKISKSSIARKLSCFKSFERFLKTQGIILSLKCVRPRVEKKLPITLSVDEIFFLLDSVKNEDLPTRFPLRDKAIFELLYATGIRCAELIGIKIRDIDMHEKTIRIIGKGRKERVVLFGEKAKAKVVEYLQHERINIRDSAEHLFLSSRNTPLNSRAVQRVFVMFRTFLKIDRSLSPHKIRHSFATHLLNQGADLRMIQELLGHASLATTEKYTHVSSAQLAAVCDELHPLNSTLKKKVA